MQKTGKNQLWIVFSALLACLALLFLPAAAARAAAADGLQSRVRGQELLLYIPKVAGTVTDITVQIGNTRLLQAQPLPPGDREISTVLLIDNSFSISGKNRGKLLQAAAEIIASHHEREVFTLATYDRELHVLAALSSDYPALQDLIREITFFNQESCLKDVLSQVLQQQKENAAGFCRIIVLSDGSDDHPLGYTCEEIRDLYREEQVPVYAVGSRYEEDLPALENLFALARSTGGSTYLLDDVENVTSIAQDLAEKCPASAAICHLPEELLDGSRQNLLVTVTSEAEIVCFTSAVQMPFSVLPGAKAETIREDAAAPDWEDAGLWDTEAAFDGPAADGTDSADPWANTADDTEDAEGAPWNNIDPKDPYWYSEDDWEEDPEAIGEAVWLVNEHMGDAGADWLQGGYGDGAAGDADAAWQTEGTGAAAEDAGAGATAAASTAMEDAAAGANTAALAAMEDTAAETNAAAPAAMEDTAAGTNAAAPAAAEDMPAETDWYGDLSSFGEDGWVDGIPHDQESPDSSVPVRNAAGQETETENAGGQSGQSPLLLLIVAILAAGAFFSFRALKARQNAAPAGTRSGKKPSGNSSAGNPLSEKIRPAETHFGKPSFRAACFWKSQAGQTGNPSFHTEDIAPTTILRDGKNPTRMLLHADYTVVLIPDGDYASRIEKICGKPVSIGRKADCSICISDDSSVSGIHCIISRNRRGELTVRDNNSSNGTFLNDQKLQEETPLETGDILEIGRTRYQVQVRGS